MQTYAAVQTSQDARVGNHCGVVYLWGAQRACPATALLSGLGQYRLWHQRLKDRKHETSFAVVDLDDSLWRFGEELRFGQYTGFEGIR